MSDRNELKRARSGRSCLIKDISLMVLLMLWWLPVWLGYPSQGVASSPMATHELLQQGQRLYEGKARCQGCHGRIAVRRPLSEDALFSVIKFGVPKTAHFPFQYLLSDAEIWAIVHFQLQRVSSEGQAQD